MARKRRERKHVGLFDVPGRRADGDDSATTLDSVSVFGGPTHDSRLFGGPGRNSGLFDAPERAPGDMPGLFDRPSRAAGSGRGWLARLGSGRPKSVGLFDKPPRGGRA